VEEPFERRAGSIRDRLYSPFFRRKISQGACP